MTREILKKRARQLAESPSAAVQEETVEVIEFLVAQQSFALETGEFREVYTLKDVTRLPCVPEFVVGVVNVRGQIITVVDLGSLLGMSREVMVFNKLIIVERGAAVLGLLADEIVGGRVVARKSLVAPPPSLAQKTPHVKAVTEDRLAVLSVDSIFDDARFANA